jgi:hypothetical protein
MNYLMSLRLNDELQLFSLYAQIIFATSSWEIGSGVAKGEARRLCFPRKSKGLPL